MQRARLIPTTGVGGQADAEQRATSATLAVLSIVRDFSREIFGPLGASKAEKAIVETFTEVEVKCPDGNVRPDGLVVVKYGKTVWRALVEVKTGGALLDAKQLNSYLDAAREVEADLVISISNEIGIAGAHPTEGLKVRSNSRVKVHHYSWSEILSKAVKCKVHAGVDDPEQSWILAELIRYLEHPASGVTGFSDMGPAWVDIRDGARQGTLTKRSDGLDDIATKWDELLRHLALRLSSETGAEVAQLLPKAQQDPKARLQTVRDQLLTDGVVTGDIRVPGTASDIGITADMRARNIVVDCTIVAPEEKKGKGSVTWLTRQINEAPRDLVIEAFERNGRTPRSADLAAIEQDPTCLLPHGKGDVQRFRLVLHREAGQNRKSGGRSPGFVDTVNQTVDSFYEHVLQNITPWVAPTPKVKRVVNEDSEPQPKAPVPVSAQDQSEASPISAEIDLTANSNETDQTESVGLTETRPLSIEQ